MEAFAISTGITALAEIGDKSQLLALMLAARFRRPLIILLGIFAATAANHAFAGVIGATLAQTTGAATMRWLLGASFLAMAVWALVPDRDPTAEDEAQNAGRTPFAIFATTAATFFWLEMGDKTQLATVALTARFAAPLTVVAGTTLGLVLANVPGVCLGARIAGRPWMRVIRGLAAGGFAAMGVAVLLFGA